MKYRLKLHYPNGRVDEFEFDTPTISIGRGTENSLIINNPSVSFRHAKILEEDGLPFIEDLMSRNGTFLNGDKIERARLFTGDIIEICDIRIEFGAEGVGERSKEREDKDGSGVAEAPQTAVLKRIDTRGEGRNRRRILIFGLVAFLLLIIITLMLIPTPEKKEPRKVDEAFFIKLEKELKSPIVGETDISEEEALRISKEIFDVAESKIKLKDVRKENRYKALLNYRRTIAILLPLQVKPPIYDLAIKRKNEIEIELFDILSNLRREYEESRRLGKKVEESLKLLEDFLHYYPCEECETIKQISKEMRILRGT